ncbi:MAG: formylglycine-generating enzyme family protein [Deltaproteobacteria bacterium]|nr:formylglycine-generating enzyme family protein [Deltaproteobacteria bacterium]
MMKKGGTSCSGRYLHAALPALLLALGSLGCARYTGSVLCAACEESGVVGDGPTDGALPMDGPDGLMEPSITIVPGSFSMGSPEGEICREPWSSLETEHPVALTRGFRLATTEVTQSEFSSQMGYTPSTHRCDECPVETLSWHEAAAYCNALSDDAQLERCYECEGTGPTVTCAVIATTGNFSDCLGYRLPTEAEWEYTIRAGSSDASYLGPISSCDNDPLIDQLGWYKGNSSTPQAVGGKKANAWGLHDMGGNVWEWCNDWHIDDLGTAAVSDPWGPPTGTHRIVRGGSFEDRADRLRSAMRDSSPPSEGLPFVGFRWARTTP